MVKHAASTEDVEHCVEGECGVVEAFSASSVIEKLEGLGRVSVAETNPFEDLVD